MRKAVLLVNSACVKPKDNGIPCTNIKMIVDVLDRPVVKVNGYRYVTIRDSFGNEHLVHDWFLDETA